MGHENDGCCHHAAPSDTTELRSLQRRLGICSGPALLLWAVPAWLPPAGPLSANALAWGQAALATLVVVAGAGPFFSRALRGLNMFTLVGLSIGTAWLSSVVQLAAALTGGANAAAPVLYFETAATLTVVVLVGQVLEQRARRATLHQLTTLYALLPRTARRLRDDGTDEEVPVRDIRPDDRLRVAADARVPVDGVVCEGRAELDVSWVSGESMPRTAAPGEAVVGGSRNGAAAFVMRAEKVGEATLIAQVRRLVGEAQQSRARAQRLADRVSAWFVPAIVAAALLTVLAWWLLGSAPLSAALVRGATVCIVACPCALGLATPVAITVAVGRAAAQGIVVRQAEALENLAAVDTLVVDKTGTLTVGRPQIATVVPAGDMTQEKLLYLAATLEQGSTHPLAYAFESRARSMNITPGRVHDCVATAGVGLRGHVDGHALWLGKPEALGAQLLVELGVSARLQVMNVHGQTLMLLLVDDKLEGIFGAADAVREGTPEALAELQACGLEIVMLTGDNQAAALMVADTLNIREVHADMLPEDKLRHVRAMQAAGRKVAMAGDGINDAPALAQADVGLALARDAHIAMPEAGVNLMHADLRAIGAARRLSVATLRVIRQNLVLAFAYNAIAVPVAAGAAEALGIGLSPGWAGVAMGASSVLVVTNALRLRRVEK